jgi:hypothetical protein
MEGMSQCTQTYVDHSSSFDIGSTISLGRAALATLPGHRSRREDGCHQYQRAANHEVAWRDPFVDYAEPSKMSQYDYKAALGALGAPPQVASTPTPTPTPTPTHNGLLPADGEEGTIDVDLATLCADCHVPIRADPIPEEMYIFLHALRYSMSLSTFERQPPKWAEEGWRWGQPL